MLIKLNQLSKPAQAARWQSRVDIAGLCIGRGEAPQPPWISLGTAQMLRSRLSGVRVAVALNPSDGFDPAEIAQIVEELSADYYEYTAVDWPKRAEFSAELNRISNIACRKIANGFFIRADDCGSLSELGPHLEMMSAGVELFQFDVESAIADEDGFTLSSSDLRRANTFFESVPVLVSDGLSRARRSMRCPMRLNNYPIVSARGFFFNIAPLPSPRDFLSSSQQWLETQIMRMVPLR